MLTKACRISFLFAFLVLLALPMAVSAQENADWSGALASMGVSLSSAPSSLAVGGTAQGSVSDVNKLLGAGFMGSAQNGDAVTVINQGDWHVSITHTPSGQVFITQIPAQFRQ
ncbi:MAG: hypothetical protein D6E12_12555 [Desulfovibrio sp.]|nr:MAG: hypothetical protein D6E12_12555 [Desulfovibrio sp.]